jgi:hypothetical protein
MHDKPLVWEVIPTLNHLYKLIYTNATCLSLFASNGTAQELLKALIVEKIS